MVIDVVAVFYRLRASMKVPPKRKGNTEAAVEAAEAGMGLNESPSEKEGKFMSEDLPSAMSRWPQ